MAGARLGAAMRQIGRLFDEGTATGLADAQLLEHFVARGDAIAFATLVERHGPMVLGVCRAVIRDPIEVEDAFQATFLVLIRKAATIRVGDTLGGWLHRVAYRIAVQSSIERSRRQTFEHALGDSIEGIADPTPTTHDGRSAALHEEVARLPEKYRRPIVLCYLEGQTHAQAAFELGWGEATIRRRLSNARELLRSRLIRRGFGFSPAVLVEALAKESSAAVPRIWVNVIAQAAVAMPISKIVASGGISAAAAKLAQSTLATLFAESVKGVALVGLTLTALTLIGLHTIPAGLAQAGDGDAKKTEIPAPRQTKPTVKPEPREEREEPGKVTVAGRVIGPDGKPVVGAKIFRTPATNSLGRPYQAQQFATSDLDGRFRFLGDQPMEWKRDDVSYRLKSTVVAATVPGFGIGWEVVAADEPSDNLTIRLVEDTPIVGQIIDLEERPVSDATIQVLEVRAREGEDLDSWLAAVQDKANPVKALNGPGDLPRYTIALSPKVTTDAEGRFRITGVGRDRVVLAQLDGPRIVSEELNIVTRPGEPFEVLKFPNSRAYTYYGASFQFVAAPCKPIIGVVRDKETKQPLAGIMVRSHKLANSPPIMDVDIVRTTTDAHGRYLLTGMPMGEGNRIMAIPGPDSAQPYLIVSQDVPDSPGLRPVTVDIELKRGVWIAGKITDKATGKPLRENLWYFPQPGNPDLNSFDSLASRFHWVGSNADGSYRIAGLPGPGLIAVERANGYLAAPDRYGAFAAKEPSIRTVPMHPSNYSAIARFDPRAGVDAGTVTRNVTLDPAWTFSGTVLGPDGKPMAGANAVGIDYKSHPRGTRAPMKTPEFTVSGFNPQFPQDIVFQVPAQGLVGVAVPPETNGQSITVTMRPGASLTGRLVDADGRPQADVELMIRFRSHAGLYDRTWWLPGRYRTGRDGRFQLDALPPDCVFDVHAIKDGLLIELPPVNGPRPGQSKDLGDVKTKRQ